METLGLYLHIPFCLGKCRYCDFYSGAYPEKTRKAYVEALCRHLAAVAPRAAGYTVDTVYFGGGTPTILDGADFARILHTVRGYFTILPGAEITAEANPATVDEPKATELLSAGVNRLSIGAQSLDDGELRALGRRHTKSDFLHTVKGVIAAGFSNLSADLMVGIPGQSPASFAATLGEMLTLHLPHLSVYSLRIEEGTPFYRERATLSLPGEDAEEEIWQTAIKTLTGAGYRHYEISNFALPGYESKHNLRYWLRSPYLGFGPGAHSFFENVRFETPRDLTGYLAAADAGAWASLCQNAHRVGGKEEQDEYVMLRMRLDTGVEEADFARRFGTGMETAYGDFSRLIAAGLLTRRNGRIAFTEKGFRVSNAILSDWLDFGEV